MAELIQVSCPHCDSSLKLKNRDKLGKRVPCPKCKKPFVLKEDSEDILDALDEFDDDDYGEFIPAPPPRKPSSTSKKKRSKKSESSNQVLYTIVAGVVLVGLIVGGMMLFSGSGGVLAQLTGDGLSDFSFLPPDAEILAKVDVQKIWNAESTQTLLKNPLVQEDLKKNLDEMEQKLGFRPEYVESVTIGVSRLTETMGTGTKLKDVAEFIGVVRLKKELNLDHLKSSDASLEVIAHDGKDYLRLPSENLDSSDTSFAAYLYDSKTLVAGPERSVKLAIERGPEADARTGFDFSTWDNKEIAVAFLPKGGLSFFKTPISNLPRAARRKL